MFVSIQYGAFIDLIDENGRLANIHKVDPQTNVLENFEDRLLYIPVMLEKSGDDRNPYKMIRPLLTDWEKRFPQLERKIKILTGELKRKKSPVGKALLDTRGKGIDRKASSSHKSDTPGRSSSNVGRPPSIMNQSGRMSTSTTGRKSIVGHADKTKGAAKGKSKKK